MTLSPPLTKDARRKPDFFRAKTDEQRENTFFRERERERAANAEKTLRLKALRLEKESRERKPAGKAVSEGHGIG